MKFSKLLKERILEVLNRKDLYTNRIHVMEEIRKILAAPEQLDSMDIRERILGVLHNTGAYPTREDVEAALLAILEPGKLQKKG